MKITKDYKRVDLAVSRWIQMEEEEEEWQRKALWFSAELQCWNWSWSMIRDERKENLSGKNAPTLSAGILFFISCQSKSAGAQLIYTVKHFSRCCDSIHQELLILDSSPQRPFGFVFIACTRCVLPESSPGQMFSPLTCWCLVQEEIWGHVEFRTLLPADWTPDAPQQPVHHDHIQRALRGQWPAHKQGVPIGQK